MKLNKKPYEPTIFSAIFNPEVYRIFEDFKKENIIIKHGGEHKEYFRSFFFDTFYNQSEKNIKESISNFLAKRELNNSESKFLFSFLSAKLFLET